MYVVINPDGKLVFGYPSATAAAIRREVGPPGFDMVRLADDEGVMAFVNDEGLFDQAAHPRNIVGGALLACLGARPNIIAGRIVVTGWDPYREIVDLVPSRLDRVMGLRERIVRALAGADDIPDCPAGWAADVRAYAEHVRSAETPVMRSVKLEG